MTGEEEAAKSDLETARRRLLYLAGHRGFKEADLILGRFAEAALAAFSERELGAFAEILERSDHDIYAWVVVGAVPPDGVDADMIARLRDFARRGGAAAR